MRDLVTGERAEIRGEVVLELRGRATEMALIALDGRRAATDAFPPIDTIGRELRPGASFAEGGRLAVRLDEVPDAVARLVLVAFDPAARPLCRALQVVVSDLRFAVDLDGREDAALILVELYRRADGWRIAANGQGFSGGLVMAATAYGADPAWPRRLGHRDPDDDDRQGTRSRAAGPSSGSGVAVDERHVLSNAHVVEGGGRITVATAGRQVSADLVFDDPRNDLALLRVETVLPATARFRPGLDLHLGDDVVVLGFPLQGLLASGPQASAGNVAALCGVGNDSSMFQFTAPISSGSSGGPILDMAGDLVGIASSSLDLDRVRRSGANAENVNFGIKGAVVRSFLDAYGLQPRLSSRSDAVGRAAIVRQMRDAVFRIGCA